MSKQERDDFVNTINTKAGKKLGDRKYDEMIKIYEQAAEEMVARGDEVRAADLFLHAVIGHLVKDGPAAATEAVERYCKLDTTFSDSHEAKFALTIIPERDHDAFTDAVNEFDSVKTLDPLLTSLLLQVKRGTTKNQQFEDRSRNILESSRRFTELLQHLAKADSKERKQLKESFKEKLGEIDREFPVDDLCSRKNRGEIDQRFTRRSRNLEENSRRFSELADKIKKKKDKQTTDEYLLYILIFNALLLCLMPSFTSGFIAVGCITFTMNNGYQGRVVATGVLGVMAGITAIYAWDLSLLQSLFFATVGGIAGINVFAKM